MARILLTDHHYESTLVFAEVLQEQGHEVHRARGADDCLAALRGKPFDVLVLDMDLPITDGFAVLRQLRDSGQDVTVIAVVGSGEYGKGKRAVQDGAFHYLTRPVAVTSLQRVVEKAEALGRIVRRLAHLGITFFRDYHREKDLFRALTFCASADTNMLIQSPLGGGGQELATAIHLSGIRKDRPMVSLDCGLNPVIFERELYGYVKGAFLGAAEDRAGLVEKARGGIILLENVHLLGKGAHRRLQELLTDGKYGRVGSQDRRSADIRVVALSHPEFSSNRGEFPMEIYRLISNVRFEIPNLRECMSQSPAEAGKLFNSLQGKPASNELSSGELELLAAHRWPGNFRELSLVAELRELVRELRLGTVTLEREIPVPAPVIQEPMEEEPADLQSPSPAPEPEAEPEAPATVVPEAPVASVTSSISAADLTEDEIVELLRERGNSGFTGDLSWILFDPSMDYGVAKDLFEKTFIDYKLRQYNGNVTVTARELGLGRRTLQEKMKKCGIESQDYREDN